MQGVPTPDVPMRGGRTLLVATNSVLIDQVLQLAGLVGVDVVVAGDGAVARTWWRESALVLVTTDLLPQLQGVPRRSDVVIIEDSGNRLASHPAGTDAGTTWSQALALGAEVVLALPEDQQALVHRLREVVEGPPRQGVVIGVLGGCGGAGASTLAVGLATAAARRGDRVLALDADPLGGGLDLLLGAEELPGARWPDLVRARGRLSAATLDYALPHMNGVAVLAHARNAGTAVPADAVTALMETAVRGYDLVVVDIGRALVTGKSAGPWLEHMQALVIVVPNRLSAVAAAMSLLGCLGSGRGGMHLVVRQRSAGLGAAEIGQALGLTPVSMREQSAVPAGVDRGELPGGFLRACGQLHRKICSDTQSIGAHRQW